MKRGGNEEQVCLREPDGGLDPARHKKGAPSPSDKRIHYVILRECMYFSCGAKYASILELTESANRRIGSRPACLSPGDLLTRFSGFR